MAILIPHDLGGEARPHPLKVLRSSNQVATVTGAVAGPLSEVATPNAGALQSDVERRPVNEGREPFRARHARSECFSEGMIGKAKPPLAGIQFVGSRLTLMEGKAGV